MTTTASTEALVPRDQLGPYYAALDAKHFAADAVGSKFAELSSIEELLTLAVAQRGDLDGDDRERLRAAGAEHDAFLPQCRYLLVHTPGTVGIVRSEGLADDTVVELVLTKPGAPLSLVVAASHGPTFPLATPLATLIVGPAPDDVTVDGDEIVWTAHPGIPIPSDVGTEDRFADLATAGHTTLGVVRERVGHDIWVQVRVS